MTSLRKRIPTTLLTVAVALSAVPAAMAHARPKVMIPAADTTVPAPSTISVTFSEPVEAKFSSLSVTEAQGKTKLNAASSTPAANDSKTLKLALPTLKPGPYPVHWVSVATDGHRMAGEYQFTVK